MTRRADQILVLSDQAVTDWLHNRFGLGGPDDPLIGDRAVITFDHRDAVKLHVSLFVGADDLAAFPTAGLTDTTATLPADVLDETIARTLYEYDHDYARGRNPTTVGQRPWDWLTDVEREPYLSRARAVHKAVTP